MQNLYKGVQVMSPAGNLEYTYPLFDTFWNNTGLRATVWPSLPAEPNLEQKEESLLDFKDWVSSLDSILYDFIYIK